MILVKPLRISDILKEVQPSTILYSPNGEKVERATILSQLLPEIASGMYLSCFLSTFGLLSFLWFVADSGMMMEPIMNRSFPKLRTVVSTEWDDPQYHGILNFRALLVEQAFPDLVSEVSRRLENEPETVLLRSYAYSEGRLWKVGKWNDMKWYEMQ